LRGSSRPQAEKNVLSTLALKALSDQENINIDDSEVDLKIKDFEKEIKNSPKKIDIEKLRDAIRNDLMKEKLIKWLEENSQIEEKVTKGTKTSSNKSKATKKTTKSKTPINSPKDKKKTSQTKAEKK